MPKKNPKKRSANKKIKRLPAGPIRRKSVKSKPRLKSKKEPKLPDIPVGRITHYFSKARACALRVENENIRIGDTLFFKGHTTRFKQKVTSLQIDRKPVREIKPGEEAGIRVRSRVREHDLVFKL